MLPKGDKGDGGTPEASTKMVLGDSPNEPGVPSHVDRRRRKIPLLTDLSDNVLIEKIPGTDPRDAPPIKFANRQDEIHYYQRLIEVDGQKIENYEKAIAEFMKNDDKENAKYYLDLLNTARKNRGQHESELHKAVQKPE